MSITLKEHASSGYRERTKLNADNADLTIAFTVDEHTAGERLTRSLATEARYGRIDLNITSSTSAAKRIQYLINTKLCGKPCEVINIAGNGIYTLANHGWTQDRINIYLRDVFVDLRDKLNCMPSIGFRSGGQTGVDIACAVAAHSIGVDAIITFPKGFRQRGADKLDFIQTEGDVMREIERMSSALLSPRPAMKM
jgi:hypothetical protein